MLQDKIRACALLRFGAQVRHPRSIMLNTKEGGIAPAFFCTASIKKTS
jgi:hypothetical protein